MIIAALTDWVQLAAPAPFVALGVATNVQVRAEPYGRRWRVAGRLRRVCRPLSLLSYSLPGLLYAVQGSAWAFLWLLVLAAIARSVAWNRRVELRLYASVASLVRLQTAMLETWHEVWRLWDREGRPTEGAYYEIVRFWPVPSETTWRRSRR